MASGEWEKLRVLLSRESILEPSDGNPVLDRSGARGSRMFYSWPVILSSNGLTLAAHCLLDRLKSFESVQLVCHGYAGLPLLSACVLLSEGRYHGLCIRESKKSYGALRKIEGAGRKDLPVTIVDDSLSSGHSMSQAVETLEEHGYRVEGCLSLVYFPGRGGAEWAESLGYRFDYLFDVFRDLGWQCPSFSPIWKMIPVDWSAATLEDGLSPPVVVRHALEHFLAHGNAPLPPAKLDRTYECGGGVFVSLRDRETNHRFARDGLWHFDASESNLPRDLVLAAIQTARSLPPGIDPGKLKIGVTLCGELEKISPGKMDFSRYAIVVRGHPSALKMGGALPNTQYFISEIQQFHQAWRRNASLTVFESFELYRHEVQKLIEPGCDWLPYGAPQIPPVWETDWKVGCRLTARVQSILAGESSNIVEDLSFDETIYAVAVTLFDHGVLGCIVMWDGTVEECLDRAAEEVLQACSDRLAGVDRISVVFSVSILHHREIVDDPEKLRLGLDSLGVQKGNQHALFLPFVASYYNLDKNQMKMLLLQKAGIDDPPQAWLTFQTSSWIHQSGETRPLHFGFPSPRSDNPDLRRDITMLAEYIAQQCGDRNFPAYHYDPLSDTTTNDGPHGRILHAVGALQEAAEFLENPDLAEKSKRGLTHFLENRAGLDACAKAQLLLGLCKMGHIGPSLNLAKELHSFCQTDGSISELPANIRMRMDHDFLPGQILLALATCAATAQETSLLPDAGRSLHWYQRRFRLAHPWGMIIWHPQCWRRIHALTGDLEAARFVFEIADWALDWQCEVNGAFITNLDPNGPGFHTACILEGIADALLLALDRNDTPRADAYSQSIRQGIRFLDQLILREDDLFIAAHPERSLGGVRGSLNSSAIRIDFVSHVLLAYLKAATLLQ